MIEPVVTTMQEGPVVTMTLLCGDDVAARRLHERLKDAILAGDWSNALRRGSLARKVEADAPMMITPSDPTTPR